MSEVRILSGAPPRPIQLRGEPLPGDVTTVVRAGSLDADRVRRTTKACHDDFGFNGMSVFAALDNDVGGLFAERVGNMQRYARYWTSTAGSLRDAGFPLFDTEDRPHFDVVLPDLSERTVARLLACFLGPVLKAKQP